MKKILLWMITMVLLAGSVFACKTSKGLGTSGIPDLGEVKRSESLYGQNKEAVLAEYELSTDDIVGDVNTWYFGLNNTRSIGGLSFLYRLAFNERENYIGQDLEYIGDPGSTADEETVKAVKTIYQEAVKKYGEPENDDSVVVRKHLSDRNKEDQEKITYSTYDIWHLG